jgi:hypothetical protein
VSQSPTRLCAAGYTATRRGRGPLSPLTDREDALQRHRYRAEPGGEILPGVTSVVEVATDKGGMIYAAAEAAAAALIAKPQRRKLWIAEEREYLLSTHGGPKAWREQKRALGRHGSDEEVLVHWARRRHAEQWREKADLGNRVHEIAAQWAAGRAADVGPDEEGFIDALEKFWQVYLPETDRAEFVIVNPFQRYGGRPDWYGSICLDPIDDLRTRVLLDFKTGSIHRWELALQCAAYLHGYPVTFEPDGSVIPITRSMERLAADEAFGIYLRNDGTYEVVDPFEYMTLETAFEQFRNALEIFVARREHERAEKRQEDSDDD